MFDEIFLLNNCISNILQFNDIEYFSLGQKSQWCLCYMTSKLGCYKILLATPLSFYWNWIAYSIKKFFMYLDNTNDNQILRWLAKNRFTSFKNWNYSILDVSYTTPFFFWVEFDRYREIADEKLSAPKLNDNLSLIGPRIMFLCC